MKALTKEMALALGYTLCGNMNFDDSFQELKEMTDAEIIDQSQFEPVYLADREPINPEETDPEKLRYQQTDIQLLPDFDVRFAGDTKRNEWASKHNSGCLQRAADDEPIFVLKSTDESAPKLVMLWISENMHRSDDQLRDAFECALAMKAWRKSKEGLPV